MYLSKLEILGFKSFAQKTSVDFNEGITSIVGPNGCGKTNIVDAIRWCLGEQRSGALRSDKMENVIFNGTSSRKPMGMAEVSLTIENTKGILPTEYTDVTITRRIFRSGESEYLLNKNICRLKDITNLFLDTGIGANAYSVIELKMVETILSNKAEERRTMFEEAAGVNKYKLRRRLALRKLDDVKSDLTRVNDIVSEVDKKVRSLERQAKKADRYNTLSSRLRELELDLAERELSKFVLESEKAKALKAEASSERITINSDISRLEDEISEANKKLLEIETELKRKRAEVAEKTEAVYNLQRSLSVEEERKSSLSKNLERFNTDLKETEQEIINSEEQVKNSSGKISSVDEETESRKKKLEELISAIEQAGRVVDEKREILKTHSDLLIEKFKEISTKENDLKNVDDSLGLKKDNIKKLNDDILSLTNNVAKTVGFIEELNNDREQIKKNLEEAEELYSQKQKEKEELSKELSKLKEEELELRGLLKSLGDKISFIRGLIENLEGISKGAKALIESKSWSEKDHTILAHIGNSDEKYRLAVEAALRNNLNNILIQNLNDLKKGIDYLKQNEIGKASFFINNEEFKQEKSFSDKIQDFFFNRKKKKIEKDNGFETWTSSCIIAEDKWKPYFEELLENNAITTDLNSAIDLAKKYNGFSFSTPEGDIVFSTGIVEAGSLPSEDDSLFGRKQYLEKLEKEYPEKAAELERLKTDIEQKEKQIDSIDLRVLSDQGRLFVNDLANVEKQIAQFEFENKKANDEIDKVQAQIQNLAAEANQLDSKYNELQDNLNTLVNLKEEEDRRKEELEKDFNEAGDAYSNLLSTKNEINIDIERLSGEKKNLENLVKRAEESIESFKRTIEKRKIDIKDAEDEINLLDESTAKNRSSLEELNEQKSELLTQESEIDSHFRNKRDEVTEIESKLKDFRKEKEQLSDSIHTYEMKLNEYDLKSKNLVEHIEENYSLTLQKKEFDDLDSFNFLERSNEVHELKQRVKNLGPINLLAYSEFEEERERLDFLNKQQQDLLESEKDIVQTIEEINTTAQAQFLETFEKIRENFIKIFRGLFNPGDEADLKIEEDADPLEAKIEIVAKPKGKRPTSIELLSGGEKTLTAIALLFAIYLVKPSPFCILDEIDAPLDDANIDRFTKILQDFSEDTQFIVVTHNKRTMESAETLYGVTMQEEGISKLVGVRFNEDLDFVS